MAMPTLDCTKVQFGEIKSPGTKKIDRKIINLPLIYRPPFADNPVRTKGIDVPHSQKILKSLSKGINYSKMPPVVRYNPRIIDGVHYDYELVCGNHRCAALDMLGVDEWIFDVYEFAQDGYTYEDSVRTFQLQENDHEPALASNTSDVVITISRLIAQGSSLVKNDEKSISEYISEYLPNIHWSTQGSLVRKIVDLNGSYRDVVTFSAEDVTKWLAKNTDLKHRGEYDKVRDMFGWSCLSRYEHEVVFNCIKKYAESGKESYIIAHTSAPTDKMTLSDKREAILNNFEGLEYSLVKVVEFYNKNKRFPWQVTCYLPQDRKNGESANDTISVEDFKESLEGIMAI